MHPYLRRLAIFRPDKRYCLGRFVVLAVSFVACVAKTPWKRGKTTIIIKIIICGVNAGRRMRPQWSKWCWSIINPSTRSDRKSMCSECEHRSDSLVCKPVVSIMLGAAIRELGQWRNIVHCMNVYHGQNKLAAWFHDSSACTFYYCRFTQHRRLTVTVYGP